MNSSLLRAERRRRGWSQAKVAEALGVDAKTVRRWEQGQAVPYPYYREQLLTLFGKTAEELGLLSGEDDEIEEAPFVTSDIWEQASSLADPAIPEALGNANNLLGRKDLLRQVKYRLLAGDNLALMALDSLPGIGKTTLAVAVATDEQVQDHFRGGVLWAGLGSHPNVLGQLARWGKLLGVAPNQVKNSKSQEAWGRALRTAIGNRHCLLIIDDAWKVEDALALQIGGPQCRYLLTTRLSQVALAFTQQGTIVVPQLEEADGLALLARFVPQLVQQDPRGARALVQAVDRLPLALCLMGNALASQPLTNQPQPLGAALIKLENTQQHLCLDMPSIPEKHYDSLVETTPLCLRAAIATSDRQVSSLAHAALCALAIFPPKPYSFSEEVALAVSQQPVKILEELQDAGLLESCGPGRYTLHQTIADYARTQSAAPPARQPLVRSLLPDVQAHERDPYSSGNYIFLPRSPRYARFLHINKILTFRPFKRFSWLSLLTLSTILLAVLVLIIDLLVLNKLPLISNVHFMNVTRAQPSFTSVPLSTSYEAEAGDNTLTGAAKVDNCSGCSEGKRVKDIGRWSKKNKENGTLDIVYGTLQFNNVNEKRAGNYRLTIYYIAGGPIGRTLHVSVNSKPLKSSLKLPSTGSWDVVGTFTVTIHLNVGKNVIEFSNPRGTAPYIDRIVILR